MGTSVFVQSCSWSEAQWTFIFFRSWSTRGKSAGLIPNAHPEIEMKTLPLWKNSFERRLSSTWFLSFNSSQWAMPLAEVIVPPVALQVLAAVCNSGYKWGNCSDCCHSCGCKEENKISWWYEFIFSVSNLLFLFLKTIWPKFKMDFKFSFLLSHEKAVHCVVVSGR